MDEREIKFCKSLGFKYEVSSSYIYIRSMYDSWRIVEKEGKYKLYHRNKSHKGYNAFQMQDYHLQRECRENDSIQHILEYINKHDKKLIKLYNRPSSIDKLFEKMNNPERLKIQ